MLSYSYVLAFVLGLVAPLDAARILAVFPFPSISHQVVFRPITQELARRGHKVVVVTPDPAFKKGEAPPNLTEIDVHDISYELWGKFLASNSTTGSKDDTFSQVSLALEQLPKIFYAQLDSDEVKTILRTQSKNFDLLLLEAFMRQILVLTHVFKVPVIQISSFGEFHGNYKDMGAPSHPFLYPTNFRQRMYELTLWEKVTELYNTYRMDQIFIKMNQKENAMAKEYFGPDIPSIDELAKNIDMLFLNVNPIWDGNRPVPPSVIHMGGLHQKPEKELPQDLKKFLDSSKNGVIYISYGTNISPSLLPSERIQKLMNVFSKLPYDILLKWDRDELPGRSENIRIHKWLPQSDLLRHQKIKLFITQGGLQSIDEAITAGVPLLGMPMLADQWYNVEKIVNHKIGLRVDMDTLTEDKFKKAIYTIIQDESYRRNMVRLGSLMRDQPQTPLQRAVWWTEHVLRHGGAKHLRSPAANISWAQYLELELVSVVLLTALVATGLFLFALRCVFSLVMNNIGVKIKHH